MIIIVANLQELGAVCLVEQAVYVSNNPFIIVKGNRCTVIVFDELAIY